MFHFATGLFYSKLPPPPLFNAMGTSSEFVASMLGGGAAGTMVDVALYPLDTIKVQMRERERGRREEREKRERERVIGVMRGERD